MTRRVTTQVAKFTNINCVSALFGALLLSACGATEPSALEATTTEEASVDESLTFKFQDEPVRTPNAGDVLTAITQPAVLAQLESKGFSLNALMAKGLGATPAPKINAQALYDATAWYKTVSDSIAVDVAARRKSRSATYGATLGLAPRAFDYGYLRSAESTYDLVAVVNRLDRKDFHASESSCGELRFVYRLRYAKAKAGGAFSRLPFEFNVLFHTADDGTACKSTAARWSVPKDAVSDGEKYVNWVATSAASLAGYVFQQLEVNVQAIRDPSEARPELGGQAEYFLRVFAKGSNGLVLKPLENTPDVAKLKGNSALRLELAAYLREHLADIDKGTFTIPEKFLATKVSSFSTHGLFRMQNRPFSQVFKPSDLALPAAAFAATKVVNSAGAVLARLDDATCSGCHQGASIAGFHVVGTERLTKTHPLNAVRVGTSAHFNADEVRRRSYVSNILYGAAPDTTRSLSFLLPQNRGGMHCVSPSQASAFKQQFGCAAGFSCGDFERNTQMAVQFGTCLRPGEQRVAGDPCIGGTHGSQGDGSQDTFNPDAPRTGNCLEPVQGTPAGLVTRACGPGFSDAAHTAQAGELCAYNGGSGFDSCAASGDFNACLGNSDTLTRGLRGSCDDQAACRDDYICQRFFDLKGSAASVPAVDAAAKAPRHAGFCVPTYFLFQMRVDGHAASGTRWLD